MAIHRHSDEWKRVIATAALAGVRIVHFLNPRRGVYYPCVWRATLPAGGHIEAPSKYEVAAKALRILEGLPLQVRKTEGKEQ